MIKPSATHWWHTLCAVPPDKNSVSYERLKRVWFDHTRFLDAKQTERGVRRQHRTHEFTKFTHETHLTASLWQNFSIFHERDWLPAVLKTAGLPPPKVMRWQWSYEWAKDWKDEHRKWQHRMCDVVIEFETGDGSRHILVVEAKALGKRLGEKELNAAYYLDIAEIAAFGLNRNLIFLIDQAVRDSVLKQLRRVPSPGIITWQQLGGLQISLAKQMKIEANLRNFIASALQFQFLQHGILPTTLSSDYLEKEPSMEAIDLLVKPHSQSMTDHSVPAWRINSAAS